MIEFVGPLPPVWRQQYDNMRKNSKYGSKLPTSTFVFRLLLFFPRIKPFSWPGMHYLTFHIMSNKLISSGDRQSSKSKVEEMFDRRVENADKDTLKPLIRVIQGLMRFMPSDRISASQALQLLQGEQSRTLSPGKSGK